MKKKFICLGGRRSSDTEDDGSDNESVDGYYVLENAGDPNSDSVALTSRRDGDVDGEEDGGYFRSPDSYQFYKSSSSSTEEPESRRHVDDGGYTDVDVKGKRLRKKLKRRQMKKRTRQVLHSTWKWFRRGLAAALPTLAGMFTIYPSGGAFASAAARQQAASDARKHKPTHVGL